MRWYGQAERPRRRTRSWLRSLGTSTGKRCREAGGEGGTQGEASPDYGTGAGPVRGRGAKGLRIGAASPGCRIVYNSLSKGGSTTPNSGVTHGVVAEANRVAHRTLGVIADQTIALDGVRTKRHYPVRLRRIRYRDPQSDKTLVFITNRTGLDALTVCGLYQSRWQVELFFKWVKQHLRVKRFLGVSENAVKSQLWIAVSVYVLVAILRKRLGIDTSLYTMLQILRSCRLNKSRYMKHLR